MTALTIDQPEVEATKRLGAAEVSMMLAQRWNLPYGREALGKLSDDLGLQTRDSPRGHRRWTIDQVEMIAPAVVVRRSLAHELADELIEARDHERIAQVAAVLEPSTFAAPDLQVSLAVRSTAA